MRLNTRTKRLRRMRGGTLAAALAAALFSTGLIAPSPTVAGASPDGTNASAPHIIDSVDAAAKELVSLQTAALRLQRQNATLVAARASNQTETVAARIKLSTTRRNRRDRAVSMYIKSFTGQSIDDVLRPTVSSERKKILTDAAARADRIRIKVLQARLVTLAGQLRWIDATLQDVVRFQATNQEQLDTLKQKIAEGLGSIGPSGPVTPAAAANGPIAKAARSAEDALVASDVATASAAAALTAATAAPTDRDAIAVAFSSAVAANAPKADHEEKQRHLAEVVGDQTDADSAELEAAWVATPPPALRAMYFALSQVGKDYVYATSGPSTYDCSGLTRRAWQENRIALPHFSGAQLRSGTHVAVADIRPGDLLAYGPDGSEHVVLSIGAGWDVEAKGTEWGVVVERADTSSERYAGASRPL